MLAGTACALEAQQPLASACTYRSCGLAVAVRWNGLAVVRGAAHKRVANLNFFLPGSVTPAFAAGGDSAIAWATRASRRRRVAAVFTDVGLMLGGVAVVTQLRDHQLAAPAKTAAVVGASMFAISVPIQFSADNALSRAVWWYNLRYAER